jgi:hypothetical protein
VPSKFASFAVAATLILVAGMTPGCNCASKRTGPGQGNGGGNGGTGGGGGGVGGGGNDAGLVLDGALSITPPDVTLDLVQGQPPAMQAFMVTLHAPDGDHDVTKAATYTLVDMTLGSMLGNTFSTGTSHGGTTALTASYSTTSGLHQAQAMIHVRVKGSFPGPDCMTTNCPAFPGDGAPGCPAGTLAPTIVYPPDGVLLPPNMSVISVMWTPFPGSPPTVKEYEVDFKNSNTDVRVLTTCATQTMDTEQPPMPSGGCELQLTPAMWDFIAKSNRGGNPVTVTVRASSDGTCATPSANSVNISFAEEDLNGGLFYWKSTITTGVGVGGQIWAKSFGDSTPETQITGMNNINQGCYGCHSLSRDGKLMVINFDDADSDDEYSDVGSTLVDVMMKASIDGHSAPRGGYPPGFQTFNADHSYYIDTNGLGTPPTEVFTLYPTNPPNTGLVPPAASTLMGVASGSRPTMPDWSPDSKSVVFVVPQSVGSWDTFPRTRNDDDHVFGGSLWTIPWDPKASMFGTATALITSQGENNYYPSYSPDGTYLVFNRVPMQPGGTACTNTMMPNASCPNDSFSNPKARVMVLSTKAGSVPIDMEKANGSAAASPVDASNSWPRWSPFVQMYHGSPLLWVTFSSTRDYGLRVLNHKSGMFQCYPADSLEQPGAMHSQPFPAGCQQPQLWMAAINLQTVELGHGDPSFPAFWLPFQDISTHNHTAQWTQTVATQPPPDMGVCIPKGGNCTMAPNACCPNIDGTQSCSGAGVCQ